MNDIGAMLVLSVQRALLGAVPYNLRAVTCGWEGKEIRLRFVFDGEIAEETHEDAHIVAGEVVADFPAPWTISEEIVRLDYPKASACSRRPGQRVVNYGGVDRVGPRGR